MANAAQQPNIVFILADDLSWSDLGCYGHPYHETPHLDQLAGDGMRFTEAYAPAPICSASRAAILTGKSPARLHFEFVTKEKPGRQTLRQPLQSPPFTLNLPLEENTLAEMLSAAGYTTGFFGKWHVSQHYGGYLGWSPTHGPLQQGFAAGDADFGSHPYAYLKKEGRDFVNLPEGQFLADSLSDKAIAFLQQPHVGPFFLYLSQYYVHDPIHTRCRWLFEKYRQRLPSDVPDVRVEYAAMVETLDHQVGRVLEALSASGLDDNTLVVFLSDNGGHPEYTGNGPLRGSKWNLYEGGIRVPMIVRWPGLVEAGSVCHEPVTACDLFATFRNVAGAPNDDITRDCRVIDLAGDDGQAREPRPLVWHFPYYHPETRFAQRPVEIGVNDFATSQTSPHSAIRLGRYKLLHFYEDDRDELYDLYSDLSEQHDLSSTQPEVASRLRQQLDNYLRDVDARLPTPNPDFATRSNKE